MFVPFCPPVTPFVLQRALIRETSGHLNATVAPGGQLAPNTTDVANKQLRLGNVRNCHPISALPHTRTPMKRLVFSVALSSLMVVAVCGTTQAAYYHHRHHHHWHHGYPAASYWNYYQVDWPGRGNNEESTR
jgi:hypothetical protein